MLRAWLQDSVPPENSYEDRPGRWISEAQWPSPEIRLQKYPLGPYTICRPGDGGSPESVPAETLRANPLTVKSPLSVGTSAGKWCSYAATPDLPGDQREEDGGSLVFSSEPLGETLEIAGMPLLQLEISADKPQAMVAVRLSDAAPDGKSTRVTYGLLNLTHRESDASPEPLEPHRRYRVTVPLNGIAQRFPRGHRLRVSVSTSYWPLAWAPPEPVELTVYPAHSALLLPVRAPRAEDVSLRRFGGPQQAPDTPTTRTAPSSHNWLLHRDLANKASVLEIINDQGEFRLDETDTEVRRSTREWYSFNHDDFTSLRGETHTERGLRADGWDVFVVTRTVLTCTRSDFLIHAELDAYEAGQRIFSDNWNRSIPRDNI